MFSFAENDKLRISKINVVNTCSCVLGTLSCILVVRPLDRKKSGPTKRVALAPESDVPSPRASLLGSLPKRDVDKARAIQG